jgi:glycosyltransferase involved in cell wall biosynthesis
VPIVMTLHNYRLLCANGLLYRDGRVCTDCVGRSPWHATVHNCYRDSKAQSMAASVAMSVGSHTGVWNQVDRFLVHSEFVKQIFITGGFSAERMRIGPNFVFDPGPRATPPSSSNQIVFVGRLSKEKGLRVLLQAWLLASGSLPNMELVIAGDGPMRAELESLNCPRVRFVGWVDEPRLTKLLLRSRAVVLPTQSYETFGRVIIEAMSAGVPVLASDIATPAEVVGEVGAEWLVEPGSEDAWSAALTRLADDLRVDESGRSARAIYEGKYTPEHALESLVSVYRDVASS